MLSIILGSLFFSAIAYGISSRTMSYFSSITSFSSFDSKTVSPTDKPLSHFGISVFIAITLPMFLFSELMGSDLFIYPLTMLSLLILEHVINEKELFSKKRIFIQSLILISFLFRADSPFIWDVHIFQPFYADFTVNAIINLAFYLIAIHLLMYLGKKEESFRLHATVIVGLSAVFFYHSENQFGLLLSLAILSVMIINFFKPNAVEFKSLSPMFGFILLILAMDILESNSLYHLPSESSSIESVRAVTGIFFFPAIRGGKRIFSKTFHLNLGSGFRPYQLIVLTVVPFVFMMISGLGFYFDLVMMFLVIIFLMMLPELYRTAVANSIRIKRD